MDPHNPMDLATLLEKVPPLLEVCLHNGITSVRNMRLVSKEASRVALLGLRSYTLRLRGTTRTDTNVGGARLLRNARLQKLTVCLVSSGN